jgi:hypothetical protein
MDLPIAEDLIEAASKRYGSAGNGKMDFEDFVRFLDDLCAIAEGNGSDPLLERCLANMDQVD